MYILTYFLINRISVESLESQTTGRTDERDDHADGYLDIDDDSILADFKMPDLGVRSCDTCIIKKTVRLLNAQYKSCVSSCCSNIISKMYSNIFKYSCNYTNIVHFCIRSSPTYVIGQSAYCYFNFLSSCHNKT